MLAFVTRPTATRLFMTIQALASIKCRSLLHCRCVVPFMTTSATQPATRGSITLALHHLIGPLHHVPAHEWTRFEDCHRIEKR
jgi:hypothetical protein